MAHLNRPEKRAVFGAVTKPATIDGERSGQLRPAVLVLGDPEEVTRRKEWSDPIWQVACSVQQRRLEIWEPGDLNVLLLVAFVWLAPG